jgi:hypothetical protein
MGLCSFLHFGMMSGTSSKAVSENNQAQPYIHTDEALRIFQYTHIRMIYKKNRRMLTGMAFRRSFINN